MHPPLDLPRAFEWDLETSDADIDEQKHVSNLVYVRWVQDVAVAHSTANGFDLARYQQFGACFVVRRHDIEYLAPLGAGERVRVSTWIDNWRGASAHRRTRVTRLSDGRDVLRALTHWVLISLPEGRPQRIPKVLLDAFGYGAAHAEA
jgi:acyl-CoA thioester hydrolase